MATLLGLFTGCGGSGVSESKPIAQVEAEAARMNAAKLQQTVEAYKQAIAARQGDLDKLAAEIKAAQPDLGKTVKGIVGGLTGSGDAEKAKADLETAKAAVAKLTARSDEISRSMKALQERMAVYARELAAQP